MGRVASCNSGQGFKVCGICDTEHMHFNDPLVLDLHIGRRERSDP